MPSFRLPFSIWKIPAWKVSRTQPPCWLGFVWLRLRREKWKRCVRTYGCWVKLLLQSWMGSSPAAPRVPSQVSSWRSLCLLGGHLLTQGGNSLSARVLHVNSCNWLKGAGEAPMVTRPAIAYRARPKRRRSNKPKLRPKYILCALYKTKMLFNVSPD